MQTVGFEECCDTSASKHEEYTLMIIKITRSTSRISINGTTFMSETIPRLPPTDIPIIHLVFGDTDRVGANVRSKCPARRTLTSSENGGTSPTLTNRRNLTGRLRAWR